MPDRQTPAQQGDVTGLDGRPLDLDRPVGDQDHYRGSLGAAVQLIEYGDYECPYCAEALPGVEQMLAGFGDRLLFAFRHFPLVSQHEHAWPAALAAEAAGRQQRFWEMHKHLFSHQHALTADELQGHALAVGLDITQFERDMHDPTLADRVRRDALSGLHSGVMGTPTFFVDGRRLEGGYRPEDLRAAIESALQAGGR